eukprot:GHVN01036392.1.p1 GENE.GHVN01036392.1~~GHVN01036392.1.p1  ORF type:complete len:502 (+),score=29.80 GHVN01036392.1:1721-3226(+)
MASSAEAYGSRYRIFFLLLVFKFFVSGLVYGYLSFANIFRYGGVGKYKCFADFEPGSEELQKAEAAYIWTRGCDAQNEYLRNSWNVGLQMSLLSGIISGPMLDTLGPRATGVFGMVVAMMGLTVWSFLEDGCHDMLMTIGWVLLGLAKQPVANCVLSVINLFPSAPGRAVSIMNGFTNFGAIVPQFLQFFIPGYSYKAILLSYTGVCALVTVLGWVILPATPYDKMAKPDDALPIVDKERRVPPKQVKPVDGTGSPAMPEPSFVSQMLSLPNLAYLTFFTCCFWRLGFYNGNLAFFLDTITGGDNDAVITYCSIFSYMVPFASVGAFILGYVTDKYGFIVQVLTTNTLGTIVCFLTLVPVLELQLLTFVLFVMSVSNLVGSLIFFTSDTFGFKYFGKIVGFDTALAAVGCWGLDYAAKLIQDQGVSKMGLCYYALILGMILFVVPAYLKYRETRLEAKKTPDEKEEGKQEEKARRRSSVRSLHLDTTEVSRTTKELIEKSA